jgi:hypothetical protein
MAERKAKSTATEKKDPRAEQIRISITIDGPMRRNMRIAAAHADMEVGDWAREILERAAEKATATA